MVGEIRPEGELVESKKKIVGLAGVRVGTPVIVYSCSKQSRVPGIQYSSELTLRAFG